MKFWDNAHALRSARRMEIETIKLINFILVMLREPVLRARESILLFELHIRRSKWKPDQPLGDFGDAIRRRMFHNGGSPSGSDPSETEFIFQFSSAYQCALTYC